MRRTFAALVAGYLLDSVHAAASQAYTWKNVVTGGMTYLAIWEIGKLMNQAAEASRRVSSSTLQLKVSRMLAPTSAVHIG